MATLTTTATPTATCVNVEPGKNGYLPPESCDVILAYVPSFAAAVLFTVLFGLTFLAHVAQAIAFRKRFCWVIIMGALWELAAFIFRTLLTRYQNNGTFYKVSLILMLLAPLWINAFLYMILGRMIHFFEDEKKLIGISATKLAILFVMLDIFAFIVQAAGAVLGSSDDVAPNIMQIGLNVYMGGMGLQELFILCFTVLAVLLHRRMIATEYVSRDLGATAQGSMSWRWLFYVMYAALALISIRIIFRLVEYSQGIESTSPILRHEAYQYCLDAAPMLIALILLNIFHPGRVLVGPDSDFPRVSRAEKKRLKREKKEQKAARKAEKRGFGRGKDSDPLRDGSGEVVPVRMDSFDSLGGTEAARSVSGRYYHDGRGIGYSSVPLG